MTLSMWTAALLPTGEESSVTLSMWIAALLSTGEEF